MEKKKIMKKKFLSVLLIVAVLIGMAGVSGTQTESGEQKADKEQKQQENEQTAETKVEIPPENEEEQKGWIGVILNGDETEAYTLAHIDGIRAAAENVSLPEQDIIWKAMVRVTAFVSSRPIFSTYPQARSGSTPCSIRILQARSR